MMKHIQLYALFLLFIFCTSCRQKQTEPHKDNIKSETKDKVTSLGSNERDIYTKYEYTDSNGKRLIIQNSFPRGDSYTDPNGKQYFKTIFCTRLINETDNPLALKIHFPVDSYEVASLPGKYFKLLVLPDTMTVDKEPLSYNYGLTDLKSFLDKRIHQPSSLKRTIHPTESSAFYVVILFDQGVGGPIRTGLSIKGQNLFYRISRLDSTPAHSLMVEKEINCGSINLNLKSLK
jgi:hypothetical protein